MGHARSLLSLRSASEIETVARKIVSKGLSVRATESLIRKQLRDATPNRAPSNAKKSAAVRDLENRLTKSLGAAVSLTEDKQGKQGKRGGTIEIRYLDLDDLDRLLERLLGSR
jgi:ParB family chromosome partitioning protein